MKPKALIGSLAVAFLLNAPASFAQQNALTVHAPPVQIVPAPPPSPDTPIRLPALRYCMSMKTNPWYSMDIGCLARIDTFCKTGETGDDDDQPTDSAYHHELSACIYLGAKCMRIFQHLCSEG